MSFKCAFNSIALHRVRTRFLSADFSKPALILCTQNIGVRYAGHSHWQNIKKTKESKDLAKCRAFNTLLRQLQREILSKSGASTDPKLNPKIASIMNQAQAINMPISTINNAIKRCELLRKNPLKQLLSYKASNGIMYMVEVTSENLHRTRMEINTLFKRQNIAKCDGNLKSAFICKSYIVAKPPEGTANPLETTVEDAIEVGAEEVEPAEELADHFRFIGEESDMNIIKSKLEKKNYSVDSADPYYIPKSPVELSEADAEKLSEFLLKLEEHPDVERVIINVV